ncbi:hypothetical protein J2X06_002545 [Lysobacter niastensis]|uniref:Uncharacterized protein n=1 Tax=Lysobacter niastensis TaxID=380629 RepID=A0ABU1WCL3_9GAMM|nr:hypothetical protein [Lysobacter niastensis]MDR7135336.1 hypothetical protein [Lysobacter niastensis]
MKSQTRLMALTTALAALLGAGTASAQDYTFGWDPRSGDVWVDTWLGDMNRYGSRYRDPFVDEMVRYYGAPRDLVTDLLVTRHWAPGDVYYACALASVIGRPCRYVVDTWERDHDQGWGNVARNLGIKPGSAEFHRLKKGFVPTYDRWARPIAIDADLERDFPGRSKGPDVAKGSKGKAAQAAPKGKAKSAQHGAQEKSKPSQAQGKGKDGNGKG